MEEKINIIIVEDNEIFREGLRLLIESKPSYTILHSTASFSELSDTNLIHKANIILMDLMMPEISGFEAAREILWNYPKSRILAITMFTDKAYLTELLEAGFKGCVFKSNIYTELDYAVQTILKGKFYFPKDIIVSRKNNS